MTSQSGEGKFGCFVTLVLLVAFGLICYRTIPVMIDKMDFEDQLGRVASEAGARNWDPESVRSQVEELAKNKDFETAPETTQVMRTAGRGRGDLLISISYWRTVNFAGYVYTFRFHSEVKSFVGTL